MLGGLDDCFDRWIFVSGEHEKAGSILPQPLIFFEGQLDGRGTIGVQALADVLVGPQLVCESVRELRDALVDLTKEGLVEGCAFTPRIEVVREMLLPEPGTSTFTGEEASDTRHKRVLDSEGHEGNRLGAADNTKRLESWLLRS